MMISIKNYIKESIFDNPEEIAKKDVKVQPKDKDELRHIIIDEVKKYKPEETVDLNFIDTSKIRDMRDLFRHISYNVDVSEWNVSNVTDMGCMFYGCKNFNCDLSKWDVSNVMNMYSMFSECCKFEGKGLEKWNVGNVESMSFMFSECEKFNCDLSKWKITNLKFAHRMFDTCKKFDCDLNNWDTSHIYDMSRMFDHCTSLKNIPSWYNNNYD